MADDEEEEEEEDEEVQDAETDAEEEEGEGGKRGSKKKLIIIVAVVLVVTLVGLKCTVLKKKPVPCTPRDELGLADWMSATDHHTYEEIVHEMEEHEKESKEGKSESSEEESHETTDESKSSDEHGLGVRPGRALKGSGGGGGGGPNAAGDENAPAVVAELAALESAEDPPCAPEIIAEGAWFKVEGITLNLEDSGEYGVVDVALRLPITIEAKVAEEGKWGVQAEEIASDVYSGQPAEIVKNEELRAELDAEFIALALEEYHGSVVDVRVTKFVIQEV